MLPAVKLMLPEPVYPGFPEKLGDVTPDCQYPPEEWQPMFRQHIQRRAIERLALAHASGLQQGRRSGTFADTEGRTADLARATP